MSGKIDKKFRAEMKQAIEEWKMQKEEEVLPQLKTWINGLSFVERAKIANLIIQGKW